MSALGEDGMGAAQLREWMVEAECAADGASRLAEALRWPVDCNVGAWSARVVVAASGLLQERARRIWRRQVTAFLVAAAVALPLSAALGFYTMRTVYDLLCSVLPTMLAGYVVATYATAAFGIVGLTYAMIPVVIGRSHDRLAFAQAWRASGSTESSP